MIVSILRSRAMEKWRRKNEILGAAAGIETVFSLRISKTCRGVHFTVDTFVIFRRRKLSQLMSWIEENKRRCDIVLSVFR